MSKARVQSKKNFELTWNTSDGSKDEYQTIINMLMKFASDSNNFNAQDEYQKYKDSLKSEPILSAKPKKAELIIYENIEKKNKAKTEKDLSTIYDVIMNIKGGNIECIPRLFKSLNSMKMRVLFLSKVGYELINNMKKDTKKFSKKEITKINLIISEIYITIMNFGNTFSLFEMDKKLSDEYKKLIKSIETYLKKIESDPIKDQLLENIKLSPLNMFPSKRTSLDEWQINALKMIDDGKSIVICAPTSSGKTVISQYVATIRKKDSICLYVAPTEPLALQIAAMLRQLVGLGVYVVSEHVNFTHDRDCKIIVGTPRELEIFLTDFSDFEKISWAVFDEIHELNGKNGISYERLFHQTNTNILALSATVEKSNAEMLCTYWSFLTKKPVELIYHERRFINLTKNIWNGEEIIELHPFACLDFEKLKAGYYLNANLSMTPLQVYKLWYFMDEIFAENDMEDCDPDSFFINPSEFLTLTRVFEYEKFLMKKLFRLSKNSENENAFKKLKAVFSLNLDVKGEFNIVSASLKLKQKNMNPAIIFNRNPYKCHEWLIELIDTLERLEKEKYPSYREELESKNKLFKVYCEGRKSLENQKVGRDERFKTPEDRDEAVKEYDDKHEALMLQGKSQTSEVDVYAPHPDFAFGISQITGDQMREVRIALKRALYKEGRGMQISYEHPLMRAIQRGIAVFTRDMDHQYQRTVQELTLNRKIGIVISDESLAFGINMPIKTSVITGSKPNDVIPSWLLQQMAGRAGRRGYDTAGDIVYADLDFMQTINVSYPILTGHQEFRYPYMAILEQKLPVETVKRMIGFSLYEFISTGEFSEDLEFYKKSKAIISKHQLFGNEDLLINLAYCKDKDSPIRWLKSLSLIEEYMEQQIYPNGRVDQYGNLNKENSSIFAQRILFNILLALFEENDLNSPYIFDIPDDFLEIWNEIHYDSTTKIEPEFGNEFIKIFEENRFPPEISHEKEFELMERIVNLGNIIRILHNYAPEKSITKKILADVFERMKDLRSKYKF
jgi:superfamily II RNA helicase